MMPCLLLLFMITTVEESAKIRTTLATKGDIWVGQKVTVVIDLLVPTYFASAPAFDVPDVPGTLILPPGSETPVLGNEKIGETTYTTQRHELTIYPQRAGSMVLPAFTVRVSAASKPGQASTVSQLKTTPITFKSVMPPGTEGLSIILSANSVEVKDSWQPEATKLKVGDAVTRTIQITVPDVPGMVVPPIRWTQLPGLRGYPRQAVIADKTDRGILMGQRIESIIYVAEQPGDYTLPAMKLSWWNLKERKLDVIPLSGRELTVAAPAVTATVSPPDRNRWLFVVVPVCVIAFLLVVVVIFTRHPLKAWWNRQLLKRATSERTRFAELHRACQQGDLKVIDEIFRVWLQSLPEPMTMESAAASPQMRPLLRTLEARLYGRPEEGKGIDPALGEQLYQAALSWRDSVRHPQSRHSMQMKLSPLNP